MWQSAAVKSREINEENNGVNNENPDVFTSHSS
jgi:hypothetical protein